MAREVSPMWGVLPLVLVTACGAAGPTKGDLAAVQAQVDELKQELARQDPTAALTGANARIDALASDVAAEQAAAVALQATVDLQAATLAEQGVVIEELYATVDAQAAALASLEDAAGVCVLEDMTQDAALLDVQAQITTLSGDLGTTQVALAGLDASVVAQGLTLADHEGRLAILEAAPSSLAALAPYVTVDATTNAIVFSGANVYVQSGTGATDGTVNGLGNLVVGYDEDAVALGGPANDRSGSHNLVVGPYHDYPSYGGVVFGYRNQLGAAYASVTGGTENAASGAYSAVAGGQDNEASGEAAVVAGGLTNSASGELSTAAGGTENIAAYSYSVVAGGALNTAPGQACGAFGGYGNTADGAYSVVAGGMYNVTGGYGDVVAGGTLGSAGGAASTIAGGAEATVIGYYSTAVGGDGSYITGDYAVLSGGHNRTQYTDYGY